MLKVTEEVASEMRGMPNRERSTSILGKIPYVSQLFRAEEAPVDNEMLVLITPRVIVQETEEQHQVVLGGITPSMIIQEEEELLGIELDAGNEDRP